MAIDKLPKNAKEIPNFPGYYATAEGEIWSGPKRTRSGYRKLKPGINRSGYLRVSLVKDRVVYRFFIHHLILETFVGCRPVNLVGCHNDDDKNHNWLRNLRWDTVSENRRDLFRNGILDFRGEGSPGAKLNSLQVRIIKRLLVLKTITQKEIGNIFGVCRGTISCIKCGTSWK